MLGVVDVCNPLAMLFCRIGRKAKRLYIALFKFARELCGAAHFGGADRRKIGRMAEEEAQLIASPLVKADRAILRFGLKVGGDVANVESHVISFFGLLDVLVNPIAVQCQYNYTVTVIDNLIFLYLLIQLVRDHRPLHHPARRSAEKLANAVREMPTAMRSGFHESGCR